MEVLEATQYEIERGKPMPSKNHNRLQMMLGFILMSKYFEKFDILTEADLELSTGWTVPDVVILSPKQALVDLIIKAKEKYLKAGVKSSWVVVPPLKQVTIFYPDDSYETFNVGMIKDKSTGVEIEMEQLFR
jgi:hypothetical protein